MPIPEAFTGECGNTQYQQATPLDCPIHTDRATQRQLVREIP